MDNATPLLKPAASGVSAAAMLLALNFILLSFFIVLVGMASAHQGKKDLVLAGLTAGFARPHDEVSDQPSGPFLPHAGGSAWQPQLSSQVMGTVASQLAVPTPEMETDADHLIVKLPLRALFNGTVLSAGAQTALPNLLQLAATANTTAEVWLQGEDAGNVADLAKQLQALGAVVNTPLGWRYGKAELQIIYRPLSAAPSAPAAVNLGRLPQAAAQAGGVVHGESK